MATSSVFAIGEAQPLHQHLKNSLNYIQNPLKTENGKLVGTLSCDRGYEYEAMIATKEVYDKLDRRQGYHLWISCHGKETSPEIMFEIMQRFAERFLGEGYEAMYAVHTNTSNLHGHLVFNSVNRLTGYKWRYERGDWLKKMQPIVNELCAEYGLETLDINDRTYSQTKRHRTGEPETHFSEMIRKDLDELIQVSGSYEEFLKGLQSRGYEVENTQGEGKHLKVKPPGMERWRRTKSLGDAYTEEQIRERILNETFLSGEALHSESIPRASAKTSKYMPRRFQKWPPIRRRYFAKLYHTGKARKRKYSEAWKYKKAIREFDLLQKKYWFLRDNHIESVEQVEQQVELLEAKHNELREIRNQSYRERAKMGNMMQLYEEIVKFELSEELWQMGNKEYPEAHEAYCNLVDALEEKGYSVTEVAKKYKEMRKKLSDVCKAEYEMRKKLAMVKEICEEAKKVFVKEVSIDGKGRGQLVEENRTRVRINK